MSSVVEIEAALKLYEANLEQVQASLGLSDDSLRSDLLQVESDLKQLIGLTKENLLEEKKKELLAQIACFDDEDDDDPMQVSAPLEGETPSTSREDETPMPVDFSCLEGVKCQAPHSTGLYGNESSYHNAIVFACETESTNFDDITVRVVFSNPTQISMLPCPYFLNGSCRYGDENCKFSHGEVVRLACLREYEEPNFSSLKTGQSVMAKDESNQLWQHATVVEVDPKGIFLDVRFSHKGSTVHRMNLESVLPLKKSSDDDEDDTHLDGNILQVSEKDEEDFAPISLLGLVPDGTGGPLGSWEQFNRGIGSKLMMSMGYVMGAGLGKNAEGRVEPVEAMLYPQGRSLDFCMTLREKSKGGDSLTVEKTLIKQQKQAEKIAERRLNAPKSTSVFDFINKTLGGKRGNAKHTLEVKELDQSLRKKDTGSSSSSSKPAKDPPNLKLQSFRVSEDILRTEREVRSLSESFNRVNRMDPKSAVHIKAKLSAAQNKLRAFQNKAANIDSKQKSKSEIDKLTKF